MRHALLLFALSTFILTCCTNNNTATATVSDPVNTKKADTIAAQQPAISCDTVLPLAVLKTGLKRWEDFYRKKYKGFCLDSFRFAGCSMNKDMIVRNVNVSPEDMELYKSLFIFSPDHKTFIDLDSYNYFVSKDGHGNLVSETGDPEEEIAVVDPALQQRIRLAYYTASDVITDDACWIGPGKVALLMLSHDERDKQDVFSAGLHIIDLSTHIESAFTSDLKMKIAATGEYTDNVRRKGIKMKR